MANINIKISYLDRENHLAVVKFASNSSKKHIDEYDGIAFSIGAATSVEQFINNIRSQVIQYTLERDYLESIIDTLDFSDWQGYETTIDSAEIVIPLPEVQSEVTL